MEYFPINQKNLWKRKFPKRRNKNLKKNNKFQNLFSKVFKISFFTNWLSQICLRKWRRKTLKSEMPSLKPSRKWSHSFLPKRNKKTNLSMNSMNQWTYNFQDLTGERVRNRWRGICRWVSWFFVLWRRLWISSRRCPSRDLTTSLKGVCITCENTKQRCKEEER